MFRAVALFALAVGVLAGIPANVPAKQPPKPTPERNAYLSNPALIATGLSLLKDKNLAINASIDVRPTFQGVFHASASLIPRLNLLTLELGGRNRELQEIDNQLKRETNELLKKQLELQKQQLETQIKQLEIAVEQAKIQAQIRDNAVAAFEYAKKRDDSLLRRLDYVVPAGKLVVVVADFSCGGSAEGAEVADEIANGLKELKEKGIDVEILVGEIKPGVVIRSERMAQELGQHFPKGTSYAVVWGTMSPRTVGKFRPYVTCAIKVDDERGYSRSYTIDPGDKDLPLPQGDSPEEMRRDQHRQLVAFACAVIPGCYASYEITQDRRPEMGKFLEFLEQGDAKTKEIAARYREELDPLTRWINLRSHPKPGQPKHEFLRRLTPVSKESEFPRLVRNTRDNSMMTLITEQGSEKPRRFKDDKGEYIAYIDVTETTNRQLVAFLNDVGNRSDGGAEWVKIEPDYRNFELKPETKRYAVFDENGDLERPAFNINYFGAQAYCRWANKVLPRTEEWRAAALPAKMGKSTFPWGDDASEWEKGCSNRLNRAQTFPTHRVASFKKDVSGIGCFDMAGSMSEWCEEFAEGSQSDRRICGGNFSDGSTEHFAIDWETRVAQTTHHRWIGFRGVVRIYVEPAKKP